MRLAVGTLSAVPIGAPRTITRSSARIAMCLAPVAVLPIAVLAAAVGGTAIAVSLPPLAAAALMIAALAMGSRGLHLDGLADTADGLSASYDRTRALAVMRKGDTGPMGVATLVVVLLIQTAALSAVLARPWGWAVAGVVICCSRGALLLCCASGVPSARPDGLGATVSGTVPVAAAGIEVLLVTGLVAVAVLSAGLPWWQGIAAAAIAFGCVGLLLRRCVTRLGGITGDVLGAAIEVALTSLLIAVAAG